MLGLRVVTLYEYVWNPPPVEQYHGLLRLGLAEAGALPAVAVPLTVLAARGLHRLPATPPALRKA